MLPRLSLKRSIPTHVNRGARQTVTNRSNLPRVSTAFGTYQRARSNWSSHLLVQNVAYTTATRETNASLNIGISLRRLPRRPLARSAAPPRKPAEPRKNLSERLAEARKQIDEHLEKSDVNSALACLEELHRDNIKPTADTYNAILRKAADLRHDNVVDTIVSYFEKHSVKQNSTTFALRIRNLTKRKRFKDAESLWEEIISEHPEEVNAAVAASMLRLLRMSGKDDKVNEIVSTLQKLGVKYSNEVYRGLFSLYRRQPAAIRSLYAEYKKDVASGALTLSPTVLGELVQHLPSFTRSVDHKTLSDVINNLLKLDITNASYWTWVLNGVSMLGNIETFLKVFHHVLNLTEAHLSYFTAYARCIFTRSFGMHDILPFNVLGPIFSEDMEIPPDVPLLVYVNDLVKLANSKNVKLDDLCYNYILLALARSRNIDHYIDLTERLKTTNFQFNSYGYISQIVATMQTSEPPAEKLAKIEEAYQKIKEAPPPDSYMENYKLHYSVVNELMLSVYAFLDPSNPRIETVVQDMKAKNQSPLLIRLAPLPFRPSLNGVNNLLDIVSKYWPDKSITVAFPQHYAACMMFDAIENGRIKLSNDLQDASAFRELIPELLKKSASLTPTMLDPGVILSVCVRVLAHYGYYQFIREIVNTLEKLPNAKANGANWLHLMGAYVQCGKLNDAIACLDEMAKNNIRVDARHYVRIMAAVGHLSGNDALIFSLHDRMIRENISPNIRLYQAMYKAVRHAESKNKVIELANQRGIRMSSKSKYGEEVHDDAAAEAEADESEVEEY